MSVKNGKEVTIIAAVIAVIAVVIVAAFLLMGSKGSVINVVNVVDPNGVANGAAVIWQDACVGSVKEVHEENGKYRIVFVLAKEFKETIRADVRACPLKESGKPVLKLVGGKNESQPFLSDGSEIPGITEGELPLDTVKEIGTNLLNKLRNYKGWHEIVGWVVVLVIFASGYKFFRRRPKETKKTLQTLSDGRKANHYDGREARSCTNEYIGSFMGRIVHGITHFFS